MDLQVPTPRATDSARNPANGNRCKRRQLGVVLQQKTNVVIRSHLIVVVHFDADRRFVDFAESAK